MHIVYTHIERERYGLYWDDDQWGALCAIAMLFFLIFTPIKIAKQWWWQQQKSDRPVTQEEEEEQESLLDKIVLATR